MKSLLQKVDSSGDKKLASTPHGTALLLHYHNRIKRIIGYKQLEAPETRPIAPPELHCEDNMAGPRIIHYEEQLPEPVQHLKRPRR
jgi:hypothetical protein